MLESLMVGLQNILTLECMLFMAFGTVLGLIVGAIPGLSATTAIALLIPVTYAMDTMPAFAMIAGIFNGGMFGGSISAILFNVPGTSANLVTTFDGYPMTRQGKSKRALQLAALSSFVGGTLSVFALLILAPQLAKVALLFGAREYFWVGILGVSVVVSLSTESISKGILSGLMGVFFAMVGQDPTTAFSRYTFGRIELMGGFQMTAIILGTFTVPTAISLMEKVHADKLVDNAEQKEKIRLFSWFRPYKLTYLVSSLIGIIVGIIPAAGANIATFISYDFAKKTSKYPEKFGTGIPEGVIASEASNNGVTGGSFVPLLTLGIPGSPTSAVIMTAFMVQGVTLGPRLFSNNPKLVYGLMWALFISNFFMLIGGFYGSKLVAKALKIEREILAPMIICFSVLGVYSLRNNIFDVYTLLGFSIFSFVYKKCGYSAAAFILGYILCPTIESNLLRILQQYSKNMVEGFFGSAVTIVLIVIIVISTAFPYMVDEMTKRQKMK